MTIEVSNNKKEFKIIDHDKVVLKGSRTKWYSSGINFFHNSKTYEIKKKGIWSASFTILESGHPIGEINWSLKKGIKLILTNKQKVTSSYWLKTEKVGKWYAPDQQYILCENGETPILTIHYSLKKWKESLEAEFSTNDHPNYLLLACALFLMRQQQSAQSGATAGGFG